MQLAAQAGKHGDQLHPIVTHSRLGAPKWPGIWGKEGYVQEWLGRWVGQAES